MLVTDAAQDGAAPEALKAAEVTLQELKAELAVAQAAAAAKDTFDRKGTRIP